MLLMVTTYNSGVYTIDGDNIVVTQSLVNQLPRLSLVGITTLALLYLTFYYPHLTNFPIPLSGWELQFPVLVFIPFVLVTVPLHNVFDARLILTPDYLLQVRGLASWRERSVRLEYSRIQEIEIEQTLLQRVLGVGDIKVTPIVVGMDESVLHIHGIPKPHMLKDLLRSRIHPHQQAAGTQSHNRGEFITE
jgi:hypothetical protein